MKKGFTMIELIFVIVILGILAAVAIPKLAATRDDANIAKETTEIATAIQDIGSYYTANGLFGDVSVMTNVQFSGDGNLSTVPNYQVNGVDCIDFNASLAALGEGNFTVTNVTGVTNALCNQVQDLVDTRDLNKSYSFGGKKVVW